MDQRFSRRAALSGAMALGAFSLGGTAIAQAEEADFETQAVTLPLIGPVGGNRIHAMSFNVRVAVDGGRRSWDNRLPRILKLIRAEKPTIIGTQEGRLHQMRDLNGALSAYRGVWRGREKNGTGETCGILYRKNRLEKLNAGHLWLSTTPKVAGSISWGAKHPRMMTWVKFRDRNTNEKFFHVNAHFDHQSAKARRKSAHLVRNWMNARGLPCVVTGDFNTGAGSVPHQTLIDGAPHDAWNHKNKRITPNYRTANLWNPKPQSGRRIDWIILDKPFSVHKVGVNTWVTRHNNVPSDHWPVQAVLSL